jgi:hypothetical protein
MRWAIPIAALIWVASAGLGAVRWVQAPQFPFPLPEVERSRPVDGYVFDRPALVVTVRVLSRTEVEETDVDGGSLRGASRKAPYWTFTTLRLNARPIAGTNHDERIGLVWRV